MIILYIFVHYISDFSLSEWVKDNGLDINDLSESTIQFLLEELGIAEHFTGDKCDNTRTPYMPSILGWRNGRLYTMAYNFFFFFLSEFHNRINKKNTATFQPLTLFKVKNCYQIYDFPFCFEKN